MGFVQLRLMVLTYAYMYWWSGQPEPLAKDVVMESIGEQMKTEKPLTQGASALMDEDGEFVWLWMEAGVTSEKEMFQLVLEFVEGNYDWMREIVRCRHK